VPSLRDPSRHRQSLGATSRSPAGTAENSPAIHRWVPGRRGTSPVRDERTHAHCRTISFAPAGLEGCFGIGCPPLKRWTILGRPGGTKKNGPPIYRRDWSPPGKVPQGRPTIAQRFIAGFPAEEEQVPSGTKEHTRIASQFLSPLRGLGRVLESVAHR
jgi:hypothetical protein